MNLPRDLALSKAKIQLMSRDDSAFFTTLCFSLKHIWDDACPTAYTNGKVIGYNTKFFMGMTVAEQIFLILHEVLHVAFLHILPLPAGYCPRRANIAQDHVINLILIERGFTMPKCGYADRQYIGLSWIEVYKLLPDNNQKPMMDDIRVDTDPASVDELTREVEDLLVQASIQSKMAGDKPGTIPGEIQVFLDGLLKPKLPWNQILLRYLRNTFSQTDYSFRVLNRRFFPKHYLAGLYGRELMDLAIGVDISGSVSDRDFHHFVSEIASVFRMMKPAKITLIQFDTKIKSIDVVKNIKELLALKFSGRGGTSIGPLMEWANKNRPELLLVFTDGEFRFHSAETKSTTVWLIHNNAKFTAPFGKVIHYKI